MITALIISLFIIQLITIFVIVILYSKLSKFKELEIRQNQLVEEMDNAISVYLMEMKEENDRLIQELNSTNVPVKAPIHKQVEVPPATTVNAKRILDEITDDDVKIEQVPMDSPQVEPRKFVPLKQAANAYSKQSIKVDEKEVFEQVEEQLLAPQLKQVHEQTFEEQVIAHYRNGKTIEEIAKLMQRGKTEIELLVKFHA